MTPCLATLVVARRITVVQPSQANIEIDSYSDAETVLCGSELKLIGIMAEQLLDGFICSSIMQSSSVGKLSARQTKEKQRQDVEQQQALQEVRNGNYNILARTSIGEEGLDSGFNHQF
jgi:hypothetical protein